MPVGESGGPGDLIAEAQMLYAAAGELAGPRLTLLAEQLGRTDINESRFLQPVYRQALEDASLVARPRPSVSPTLSHGLKDLWPRLGPFDVSLAWDEATVFGELKCGSEEFALSACAWDVAKGAFCLRHGVGAAVLLVAAAPARLWRTHGLGLEFLDDGEWEMADIRRRHASGFRKFEIDGYKPVRVPAQVATFFVARLEFPIARSTWVLGISRVEPRGDAWLDWPPFVPARKPF